MKRSISLLLSLAFIHVSISAGAQAPGTQTPGTQSPGTQSPGASAEPTTSSPPDADLIRRAQHHFHRGVDFYEERNYDGALAEFSRAHELAPNYRVLYNLAQTQVERHEYVDALRLFGEYLEQGGVEIPAARRQATERERQSLLGRIATVQIESNVKGAELWVDGRSRGLVSSRHTLRLNAGMADVRLDKSGYEPVTRQLTVVGGDSVVVQMRLAPSASPETAVRPAVVANVDRRDTANDVNTELWLSVGATTLLAGATATFAILTTRENAELDRELRRYQANPARLDDTRSRVRTYAALTDGFGVATLVGLGSTLLFAIAGSDGDAGPADRADRVSVRIGSSGLIVSKNF